METFLEMCRYRANLQADQIAYTFLTDGERDELNLTYGQLDVIARRIAVRLNAAGATGGRALLLYPPGLDYIAAFFGCLYAGVTPVPLYPPDPLRMDRTLPRLQAVCNDAQAVAVLGTANSLTWVQALVTIGPSIRMILATDALPVGCEDDWTPPTITSTTLGLLQYTSGSTGTPRGVMVSHANLLYNVAKIDRGQSQGVVGVTWLPAYHDFGLIGGVLLPMYAGRQTISMSPLDFMQRPIRWLEAISRYRGTITGAPNFAFDLCSRTVLPAEIKALDLTSLAVILNGAEPVRRDTLERFTQTFAPCGFRPTAFVPCYGLAEATLGVTGGDHESLYTVGDFCATNLEENQVVANLNGKSNSRTLASCGPAIEETEVVIVDPQTLTRAASDRVGEIWVRGPGVAQGYWNRPEETRSTFAARLADSGDGPFLRTGDLGFLHAGELYVTGRLKDLIIICGRNYYPQDIERTIWACNPALKIDGGAAFSMERDGQERLVVVQEVTRPKQLDLNEIVRSIRGAILAEHDLPVEAIVLIKAGTIGKTTSGKIRRRSCRDDYLSDHLAVVTQWNASRCDNSSGGAEGREAVPPRTDTERTLLKIWVEVLRQDDLGIHDNFFDFGGHSLLATQLMSRVSAACGVTLPLRELFAHPTVAELAPVVERNYATPSAASPTKIVPADQRDDSPLSFGQQRLWFVDQLLPEVPVNNLCLSARFRGDLQTALLEKSLAEIARRHASLRTTFVDAGGLPQQRVSSLGAVPIAQFDLRELDTMNRAAEVERISSAAARQRFDLATGPLWNVTHLHLTADEHVLLLAMHHIISDGWSMGVFLRELLLIYEAFSNGQRSPLADLDIQYADFAAWQRTTCTDDALSPQFEYWRGKLEDGPAVLAMPTDRPRVALQTFHGALLPVSLPLSLSQAVEQFSREQQATLYMTLLAAFQTLLSRYTGQADISVGTAVAHRTRPEVEGLIGFFVNTLVMRGDLSGDPTFRDLLARTRQVTLEAYEHQDLPFERLVEAFAPRRVLSHSPLYQAALILQNAPLEFTGPNLTFQEVHNGTARHDLTLSLRQEAGRLVGGLEYNTDLFDQENVEHLLESFQTLLGAAVTAPDNPISKLTLVGMHDRQRLLAAAAGERIRFADDVCVHELFERKVEENPDAVALCFQEQVLTYRQLNERANRLAHRLCTMGVGPDVLVGICLNRSVELVAGMLGILKAGGAYVPLDPHYPAARLDLILRDAQLDVVVTSRELATVFAAQNTRMVFADETAGDCSASTENPQRTATANNLAYVIYTSGSTGQPKGALIEHRGVCNAVAVAARWIGPGSERRTLQFASPNFDASVLEIFATLAVGGSVYMAPEDALIPGPDLVRLLDDHRITFVILPPSVLSVLPAAPLPHLSTLVVAGEACSAKLVDRWAPGRRMINGYGPTEATVGATEGECHAGEGRAPALGRPFANVNVYLLDRHLEPVPHGMPGEIYIGGVGVARGYLNRPELTAEKFLPDRFSGRSGGRLYRTGDLARYRADGKLEFLGRIDDQVKVRGFRIELPEIEAALTAHPAIREAVVVVREQESGEKRLVAYVGTGELPAPTTTELHQFIKSHLPDYMIPSTFVALPALPVSPNGKVDRNSLPGIDRSRPVLDQCYVAPSTDVEVTLADIWAGVIGLERVGIHDNFFELGGDSLLSMQVISRAARVGLRLTPRQLFEHQTVAEQATVAVPILATAAAQEAVVGPVPLTPIQHWFFEQRLAAPEHFNQAVMLEVDDRLEPSFLQASVEHLVAHHDALRLRFVREKNGWKQSNDASDKAELYCRVDLAGVPTSEEPNAIEAVATQLQASLNLAEGPLVRVCLIDLGPARPSRLLFVIHHLAVDAFSWRILLEDLHLIYQQLSRGEAPCLNAKTTSYQRWSERLIEYAQSALVREELDYWLRLAEAPFKHLPVDRLPVQGAASSTSSHTRNGHTQSGSNGHAYKGCEENSIASARTVSASLAVDETRRLLEDVSRAYRAPLNSILLTALSQAFQKWTGEDSLLVDLEGHGREDLFDDVDLSRTVGWFTSVFPVRLCLDQTTDVRRAVSSMEAQLRDIPRRGIGFGTLKYLCQDETVTTALATLPQPEIAFNYLGQVDQLANSGGRLRTASESVGSMRSSRQHRTHLLEINGVIVGGQLRFDWTYCEGLHQRETVERVIGAFLDALRNMIVDCASVASLREAALSRYVAPRNALEAELTDICQETLGLSPLGVEDNLVGLGDGQQSAHQCLAKFTARNDIVLLPSEMATATTIATMAAVVRAAAARHRGSPLVAIRRTGYRPPLFCVHPAGGSAFPYYALAHHLGADQPVYALESRGLARHEAFHETVEAMARDYIQAIRTIQPEGPYYLAGWSFGGLVAYEMARQLAHVREQVPLVVLIDSQAAQDNSQEEGDDAFAALMSMFPSVEQMLPDQIRALSRSEKLVLFGRQIEGAGLVQPGADRWEIERHYEVFEANCRAWLAFRPQSYQGPVALLKAEERPRDEVPTAASSWENHVTEDLRSRTVPGDHLTMMREPHVRTLAQRLRRQLARASKQFEIDGAPAMTPLSAKEARGIDPDLTMQS
ncbi:MAG TPA: amino acid adenylation domain-containing protein [Pirellulales bacterium]